MAQDNQAVPLIPAVMDGSSAMDWAGFLPKWGSFSFKAIKIPLGLIINIQCNEKLVILITKKKIKMGPELSSDYWILHIPGFNQITLD